MPIKYSKMTSVDSLTPEVADQIKKMVCSYFSRYGSIYVGITNNPEKRFKQHNDKLLGGKGDKLHTAPWPLCVVVCEIKSYTKTRKFETELTNLAKKRFGSKSWNVRVGSPGRPPKNGSRGYIYLLLDKLKTEFIEVSAKEWTKLVKDKSKLEDLKKKAKQ